jgi:hypothetical protein
MSRIIPDHLERLRAPTAASFGLGVAFQHSTRPETINGSIGVRSLGFASGIDHVVDRFNLG